MILPIKDGEINFYLDFLTQVEAEQCFKWIQKNVHFAQLPITLFGKTFPTPRLEAYFAEEGKMYSYSGKKLPIQQFPQEILSVKRRIEELCGSTFNALLINLYRDGMDSNGWHADDEPELGKNPTIASLSLGVSRNFDLRHNQTGEKIRIELNNGSLLVMKGSLQHNWKHQIAKSKAVKSVRINLTFRKIS